MAHRRACRECIARLGTALGALCGGAILAPLAGAQGGEEPARDAGAAIANTKALVDPIKRCKPAEGDEIVVCGSDTERYRLSPELRAIANEGREAPPKLPRAEARAMSLDKLPYNWIPIGGRYPPGPEYNALYELVKRRTDPEADGSAPPGEGEP